MTVVCYVFEIHTVYSGMLIPLYQYAAACCMLYLRTEFLLMGFWLSMADWTSSKKMRLIQLFEERQDFCSNVIKKKDTWQKLANLLNVNGGQ